MLVQDGIHDEFVKAITAYAKENARTGAPGESGILFGPVNNASQLERVSGVIDALPSHAIIDLGGKRQGTRGYFYQATIVSNLMQTDDVVQNEIFGPVITVQKFRSEAEALGLANDVRFRGLHPPQACDVVHRRVAAAPR